MDRFAIIRELAESFAARFVSEKGYNEARLSSIFISLSSITLYFHLDDDFQRDIAENVNAGHVGIPCDSFEDFQRKFNEWPSRARRELLFMARLSTTAEGARAYLQNEKAREFAENLFAQREALLEDLRPVASDLE